MKRLISFIFYAEVLLIVSINCLAVTSNWIKNSGFEYSSNHTINWLFGHSDAGTFSTIPDSVNGGYHLRIERDQNAESGYYPYAMSGSWDVEDMFMVNQGDKFCATILARTPSSGTAKLQIAYRNSAGAWLSCVESSQIQLNSDWQLISVHGTVPENCKYINYFMICCDGTADFDNAVLSDNLLVNSDFEFQINGVIQNWFLGTNNAGSFSTVANTAHGGNCLQITRDSGAPAGTYPFALCGSWSTVDMITVIPGEKFMIHSLARTPSTGSAKIQVIFRTAAGGWLSSTESGDTTLGDSWQYLSLSGNVPVNCAYLQVLLLGTSGTAQFDKVRYSENCVRNDEFEVVENSIPKNWTYISNSAGTISLIANDTEGDNNLRLTRSPSAPQDKYPCVMSSTWNTADMVAVEPGEAFMVKVEAKTPNSGKIYMRVVFRNTNGTWLSSMESADLTLNSNWLNINIKGVVPVNCEYMHLFVYCKEGTADIDRISLKKYNLENPDSFERKTGEYWVNVDYCDEVIYCNNLGLQTYAETEIINLFETLSSHNVDGVLWRVSLLGQVTYPSTSAATIFPGRADVSLLNTDQQRLNYLLNDLNGKIDPLAIAVREARRNNIKIMIWVTLSDEGPLPNKPDYLLTNNLVIDNPSYQLVDINGNPWPGTLCYSIPEVRTYRMNMLSELLAYNADGIYLCTRTHAEYNDNDSGIEFGYNTTIADEFYNRYGVDILTQSFDNDLWLELKAEGWTTFIQQAAALVHTEGQKLWLGVKTTENELRGWPYGNAMFPWKSWLQNGYIDGLIAGHNEVIPASAARLVNEFNKVASPEQTLLIWQQVYLYDIGYNSLDNMKAHVKNISFAGGNGGAYHECYNLELNSGTYWQTISSTIANYWRP